MQSNEEKATTALDIFDDLIECEVVIVVPHIKPMVELCIALAAEQNLDDAIRIKVRKLLFKNETIAFGRGYPVPRKR